MYNMPLVAEFLELRNNNYSIISSVDTKQELPKIKITQMLTSNTPTQQGIKCQIRHSRLRHVNCFFMLFLTTSSVHQELLVYSTGSLGPINLHQLKIWKPWLCENSASKVPLLGTQQGKGEEGHYLPGRGDAMITKEFLPQQVLSLFWSTVAF